MSATISTKLKNAFEGALAGGGDPATSPLYVFGPFLSLIVGGGVAAITFGASIWLAVLTVIAISAMYRYVMQWVTDGSGGSGLSEEEFGSWAVKVNAAITIIEYTLTFLVSIAALVTFIADRFSFLNQSFAIFELRQFAAIFFTIVVAVVVTRGSKTSTMLFGPATALILIFLWVMIGVVIATRGFQLPDFNPRAFHIDYLFSYTLGGYARILALMTGIEIFANLVASYEGTARERSRRAFGSLLIVMGTTAVTMLIVGPAILALSDPTDHSRSVFTQTMDALLPPWASYTGTLIGIAVLLSAAAASAQGIQNLALGLRARHYIPSAWGTRNRFDVPSFPAWAQCFAVVTMFLVFGTAEETYLALYAAGVFVLLSMTGWSAAKRFYHRIQKVRSTENIVGISVTSFAALCATTATIVIFAERFLEGAWIYLLLIPGFYFTFDYYRRNLGKPPDDVRLRWANDLRVGTKYPKIMPYTIEDILVPLSGGTSSETAFHMGVRVAEKYRSRMDLLHIHSDAPKNIRTPATSTFEQYLDALTAKTTSTELSRRSILVTEDRKRLLVETLSNSKHDLIVLSSDKMASKDRLVTTPLIYEILYATTPPLLLLRPNPRWQSRVSGFKNILVLLDGSDTAEQILPLVVAWAHRYDSKITLMTVPEEQGDPEIVDQLKGYLETVKTQILAQQEIEVQCLVEGSGPKRTILHAAKEGGYDLIAMVSHGRGGVERQNFVKLGSVAASILAESDIPVLFVSAAKTKKVIESQ
ncbi:hypothetical protein BH10BDE1_BH10BDE1_09330 [soil metagenome]